VAGKRSLTDITIGDAVECGVLQRTAEDQSFDGRLVTLDGTKVVNFGSCSYLGLETDPRLKAGAIDAVERFGALFASSRGYMSAPPYTELESLFAEIYAAPIVLTQTTTLGHLATLPVLVGRKDAVILDRQVHASVQMAAGLLRAKNIHVESVRHNDVAEIEKRARALTETHPRVWYLADGVYSMYADVAPVEEICELQRSIPQLYTYYDDAHGMSWTGEKGRGYVLGDRAVPERSIVALSFGKGFGVGAGACLVFSDAEHARQVRNCGGPLNFSGPMPPATLGAAIASAKIHLSDEMPLLQEELQQRIQLCNRLLIDEGLPLVSNAAVPIRYLAVGPPAMAYNVVGRLIDEGFFTNAGIFPAVPIKRSGLRFTITRHHELDDIVELVRAIAYHLPRAAQEVGVCLDKVRRDFQLEDPTVDSNQPPAQAAP